MTSLARLTVVLCLVIGCNNKAGKSKNKHKSHNLTISPIILKYSHLFLARHCFTIKKGKKRLPSIGL